MSRPRSWLSAPAPASTETEAQRSPGRLSETGPLSVPEAIAALDFLDEGPEDHSPPHRDPLEGYRIQLSLDSAAWSRKLEEGFPQWWFFSGLAVGAVLGFAIGVLM